MNEISGKLFNIKSISCEELGGNINIDFLTLNDGRVLGIGDDCVVLYENMDEFWNATPTDKPQINL